jgi:DNA-binding transcriptional regulator YbjK
MPPRASRPATPRRRQLLDAGVGVLAAEGLRGLTHRAVDRAAGLPEGSCSAYLRTRSALQQALAEHVSARLLADVDELADRLRSDADCDGGAATLDLLLGWLAEPELLLARLELTMAARRDPALGRLLADQRARLVEVVAAVAAGTAGTDGRPDRDRAEALVAAYDGLLIAALAKPPAVRSGFLRQALDLVRGGLAAGPAG